MTRTPVPEPTIAPESPPPGSPSPGTSPTPSGPRIAIIIDDCGYSLPRALRFLKLPVPLTLSILPLTPHGKEVAAAAEAAGKAVMLHIPMEPQSNTAHPGPGEISTEMDDEHLSVFDYERNPREIALDVAGKIRLQRRIQHRRAGAGEP